MIAKPLRHEILKELDRLPTDLQRQVLDYTRKLCLSLPTGVPGKQLLRFAGIMTSEEAQSMSQAIKDGCEQVDEREW